MLEIELAAFAAGLQGNKETWIQAETMEEVPSKTLKMT